MRRKRLCIHLTAWLIILLFAVQAEGLGAVLYENDLSDHRGRAGFAAVYDKLGQEAVAVGLRELSAPIVTRVLDFSDGVYAAELDFFPKELNDAPIPLLCLRRGTETLPLVSVSQAGITLDAGELGAGQIFLCYPQEFILDWYTLTVLWYQGNQVQLLLNGKALSDPVPLNISGSAALCWSGSEADAGEVLLTRLSVRSLETVEVERLWFEKNGVPTFRLGQGRYRCGATLQNPSDTPRTIQISLALYDAEGVLLGFAGSLTAEVAPNRAQTVTAEIELDGRGERLVAYVWDSAETIRPLKAVDADATLLR